MLFNDLLGYLSNHNDLQLQRRHVPYFYEDEFGVGLSDDWHRVGLSDDWHRIGLPWPWVGHEWHRVCVSDDWHHGLSDDRHK
jgi:hypothetical protein